MKASNNTRRIAILGGLVVLAILVAGTAWSSSAARKDTEQAAHSVSLLYLDELAGRREQVVAASLDSNVRNLSVAIGLMSENDLSDVDHLQAYQSHVKQLYDLEKFAFVDTDGIIYTSTGSQNNIADYRFDYLTLTGPEISVLNERGSDKKVVIAVPVDDLPFEETTLVACFMEIDMDTMLRGISLQSDDTGTTFCNIYTKDGIALTDVVLGGLASEDNLLDALEHAQFDEGFTAAAVREDFEAGRQGVVSFTYNDIYESLAYVPVKGTDWLITYLIRESVISSQISAVSDGVMMRSLLQSALSAVVLAAMFAYLIAQTRRNAMLALEKETSEAENRVRRDELERRLDLQERLLEQERQRSQQDSMITAMASDYRSVYYVDLDKDEGVCYRTDSHQKNMPAEGDHFAYLAAFTAYAQEFVAEDYREEFCRFIDPAEVRRKLANTSLIALRYLTVREGKQSYEMLRMAGVRHIEDRVDGAIHAVGVGFTDIDTEMRETLARNQALSDALKTAEEASKAKTTFLSNMSHEIRTPMNAIIGLDNLALHNPNLDPKTREYLEKIDVSAHHLLSLINDVLDMSRIESGRMTLKNEEFSFPALLEQINTIFSGQCQDKGLTYRCNVIGQISDYYIGDNMKLRQVLINILGNAVKFTPEGGTVALSTQCVAHYGDNSTLQFKISDTGIGMSEEFLPHIFDTFSQEDASSTNKYGSSGLGMAISKSIVEMMNGDIEVESEQGVGTTFTVTVSLFDATEHDDSEALEAALRPSEMTVLVVDDDAIDCEHARLTLEQVGIAAEVAHSGSEAIDMVQTRHARREPYNLILVDWKMPEMDGVETTRKIREVVGNQSAIVILTAYHWDDVMDEAVAAGVDSFISKPLFVNSVLEEFSSAMRTKEEEIAREHRNLEGARVLLAEDVNINADIIQAILQMREIESERAVNGRIAVEMFAEHPVGYYDAVLMDIRMPEMDGLKATETIRSLDREDALTVPIVALTANAFDEDVQRSLQAGMNAHLTKPVEAETLFQTLESLL